MVQNQTPTENSSLGHAAAGTLAFLLSAIRSGESLSPDEIGVVNGIIKRLEVENGHRAAQSGVRPLSRTVSSSDAGFVILADEADESGASHYYSIQRRTANTGEEVATISFQKGPVGEVGFNGIQNEHLMKIVIDRLGGFQRGPFSSRDNAVALTHLEGLNKQ